MLFHVTWDFADSSEESEKRSLQVFAAWQPPEGVDFQGFYGFVDGGGGVAIIEAADAPSLARTIAPWTPWLRFDARPILPIEDSTAIAAEGVAFRDSVT
jgi:Protein of unknown function (DUF3303)